MSLSRRPLDPRIYGGPRKNNSDVIIRTAGADGEAHTGTVGPSETPDARRAAFGLFCVKRRINDGVVELTRCAPHQRGPQTRGRNDAMVWSTPEVREVCVGMEVTSYLSAEM